MGYAGEVYEHRAGPACEDEAYGYSGDGTAGGDPRDGWTFLKPDSNCDSFKVSQPGESMQDESGRLYQRRCVSCR